MLFLDCDRIVGETASRTLDMVERRDVRAVGRTVGRTELNGRTDGLSGERTE